MPDGKDNLYYEKEEDGRQLKIAKWYDVLEMLDYCMAPAEKGDEDEKV